MQQPRRPHHSISSYFAAHFTSRTLLKPQLAASRLFGREFIHPLTFFLHSLIFSLTPLRQQWQQNERMLGGKATVERRAQKQLLYTRPKQAVSIYQRLQASTISCRFLPPALFVPFFHFVATLIYFRIDSFSLLDFASVGWNKFSCRLLLVSLHDNCAPSTITRSPDRFFGTFGRTFRLLVAVKPLCRRICAVQWLTGNAVAGGKA